MLLVSGTQITRVGLYILVSKAPAHIYLASRVICDGRMSCCIGCLKANARKCNRDYVPRQVMITPRSLWPFLPPFRRSIL